jgi:hypothetical protein
VQRFSLLTRNLKSDNENLIKVSPEHRLWLNVITRAYNDIEFCMENADGLKDKQLVKQCYKDAREAANWILSNRSSPSSFLWCVDYCFTDNESGHVVCILRKIAACFKQKLTYSSPPPVIPSKCSSLNKNPVT